MDIHTHAPYFILLPTFIFGALESGDINFTVFVVWTVLRLHAPDTEPGAFSPAPTDVTNRLLTWETGLSRRQSIKVLNHLEEAGLVKRLIAAEQAARGLRGARWLLLTAPARSVWVDVSQASPLCAPAETGERAPCR